MNDSIEAYKRLIIAYEVSVRKNIHEFLQAISKLKIEYH